MNRTSVIITTYNGEKYVYSLLHSILTQSLRPDEVLIFDDCSSDSTPIIVNEFITSRKLEWKFYINPTNLGWRKNYIQGFQRATGDLIFPCDQDDVWKREKVEYMVSVMEMHQDINLLMTDFKKATNLDIDNMLRSDEMIESSKLAGPTKIPLKKIDTFSRPGCAFCFRKDFFSRIQPFWGETFCTMPGLGNVQ